MATRERPASGVMQASDWLWLLGINVGANVVATLILGGHPGEPLVLRVLVAAWPGFVISTCISSICAIAVPRLAPVLYEQFGVWTRWVLLIGFLVALAVAGSALAIVILTTLGQVPGWQSFVSTLGNTLPTAILITLIFGIYGTRIEALRSRLDRTTVALRTKERDEAEARRVASEAQMASLESRVNPHFFFNTLNSIAALTREDAARAERMTTQLASLMRSSLSGEATPLVPLGQETQSVRDYLEIEQVRFGSRLRFDIQISAGASHVLVPRLAVQTIVENSVKYAVSAQVEGASIGITGHLRNGRLHLAVTDDGPGFDVADIPDGHGLALIRARLALLYREDATLSIQSQSGRTTVAMELPATDVP
jgi:sensor histidine kinase YesM